MYTLHMDRPISSLESDPSPQSESRPASGRPAAPAQRSAGEFVLFQRPIEAMGTALSNLGTGGESHSGGPALFRTDLAFREGGNRRGFDRAVCLKIQTPTPGSEFEVMGDELESTLHESVIDSGHGVLVSAVTCESLRCLYFYCDHSGQTRVVERAEQAAELGVVCSIEHRLDTNWDVYTLSLDPSPAELRAGRGLDTMMALLAAGDDLDAVRPIGHFVFFPDVTGREAARMASIKAGLMVGDTLEPDEFDPFPGLVLVIERSIDLELIERDVEQIERTVGMFAGWHDGWESLGEIDGDSPGVDIADDGE